ncbi:hypothetical protein RUM43_011125 [Polyplax serrata]|uniref:HTH OST-type domain-containing protein n=1 Tax=Polyplax serrata TaxID=468196 RepID=A0AAN8NLJ2_POLSC
MSSVNNNIKKKLKCLIAQHPEGLWCCEVPKLYCEQYKSDLNYKEFGYTNLIQMLSELNDIFRCVRPGSDDWLLFDASLPPSTIELKYTHMTIAESDSKIMYVYPRDVVKLDDKLTYIDLKDLQLQNTCIEVCAAEVWSPSKFYIHLKKFNHHLNSFMNDLQKFYNVHYDLFKMNEWAIKPKQICVAYYSTDSSIPEEWHRAEILKILNEKSVTVFLVDFGTVTTLKTSHLRFLHRTFQFFPVQGLLAKLANVSPVQPNSKWPATASARLLELLRRPYVNAEIVDVDCNFDQNEGISDCAQETLKVKNYPKDESVTLTETDSTRDETNKEAERVKNQSTSLNNTITHFTELIPAKQDNVNAKKPLETNKDQQSHIHLIGEYETVSTSGKEVEAQVSGIGNSNTVNFTKQTLLIRIINYTALELLLSNLTLLDLAMIDPILAMTCSVDLARNHILNILKNFLVTYWANQTVVMELKVSIAVFFLIVAPKHLIDAQFIYIHGAALKLAIGIGIPIDVNLAGGGLSWFNNVQVIYELPDNVTYFEPYKIMQKRSVKNTFNRLTVYQALEKYINRPQKDPHVGLVEYKKAHEHGLLNKTDCDIIYQDCTISENSIFAD